jgi:predicted nucleic acid-binding protein
MTGIAFLIDTNVLIGVAKGPGVARDTLDAVGARPENSAISQITRIELLSFPDLTHDDVAGLQALMAPLRVFLIDDAVERATIAVRRERKLKLPDSIIVATAKAHGLHLVTLDQQLLSIVAL